MARWAHQDHKVAVRSQGLQEADSREDVADILVAEDMASIQRALQGIHQVALNDLVVDSSLEVQVEVDA